MKMSGLMDILPPVLRADEGMLGIAKSVSPSLGRLESEVDKAFVLSRIDALPESILDLLAWQFLVDCWLPGLSLSGKRELLKNAIAWHRKKGTKWAVKFVLEQAGYPGATITTHADLQSAWIDAGGGLLNGDGFLDEPDLPLAPPGWPMDFMSWSWAQFSIRLNAADNGIGQQDQQKIRELVAMAKPLRSHLVGLGFYVRHDLDSRIWHGPWSAKIQAEYKACGAADVPHFGLIGHGCEPLGGEYAPDYLDGSGVLDGHGDLSGVKAVGQPLDDGHVATWAARMRVHGTTAFGGREEVHGTLTPDYEAILEPLDGRGDLSVDVLDGAGCLDGHGDLSLPVLTPMTYVMLDGSGCIGPEAGHPHIWHRGTIRVWDGAQYSMEAI